MPCRGTVPCHPGEASTLEGLGHLMLCARVCLCPSCPCYRGLALSVRATLSQRDLTHLYVQVRSHPRVPWLGVDVLLGSQFPQPQQHRQGLRSQGGWVVPDTSPASTAGHCLLTHGRALGPPLERRGAGRSSPPQGPPAWGPPGACHSKAWGTNDVCTLR